MRDLHVGCLPTHLPIIHLTFPIPSYRKHTPNHRKKSDRLATITSDRPDFSFPTPLDSRGGKSLSLIRYIFVLKSLQLFGEEWVWVGQGISQLLKLQLLKSYNPPKSKHFNQCPKQKPHLIPSIHLFPNLSARTDPDSIDPHFIPVLSFPYIIRICFPPRLVNGHMR